jgi:hypothetical protein
MKQAFANRVLAIVLCLFIGQSRCFADKTNPPLLIKTIKQEIEEVVSAATAAVETWGFWGNRKTLESVEGCEKNLRIAQIAKARGDLPKKLAQKTKHRHIYIAVAHHISAN